MPRIPADQTQLNVAVSRKLRTQLKLESVLQETSVRSLVHRYILEGLQRDTRKRLKEQEEELSSP
jgi:hypothetical protein